MKVKLLSNVKYMILLGSIILGSCTTDLYEDKPQPEPSPEPSGPVDNVFTTNKAKKLTVNIEDAYEGKFYYTVEVFMGNPAIDEDAKMIAGSGQKVNSKVPYSVNLSLPEIMNILYIQVTDPFKRAAVYAFDITEGDMVCNIGSAGTSTKSSASRLRSETATFPEIDYSYEGLTYTKLSGKKDVTLKTNTNYVIEAGTIFEGGITFPGEGNVSLYVAGNWKTDLNNVQLEKNTRIYVLKGGSVEKAKGNGKLSLVGSAFIAIQKGGEIGTEKDNSEFSLYMTNNTRIVNEGEVDFENIDLDSDASIYNNGDFDVDKITTQSAGNKVVNMREFEVDMVEMTNGVIDNFCKFDVETKLDVKANGKINLMPGAYMEVKHLDAKGLTLNMDAKSMWVGEKASFSGQKSFIQGSTTDYALFKVDNIDIATYSGIILEYQNKINIERKKHTDHPDEGNPCYKHDPEVAFSIGQGFVEIDEDDCNGNTGNQNPGEGEGDNTDDYEDVETLPYVYMFEDNWPGVGDYDMNDLVISIQIKNKKQKNKTVSAKVIATVYAVGATKQIGAAFQLDGIGSSLVPGAEAGQDNAVFWLFKDAHEFLGVAGRSPANTTTVTLDPKQMEMDLLFTTSIDEVITVNNLNLFIVVGNMDIDKRSEIHVAGYQGTKKAAQSDLCTNIYTSVESGLMWGLCVPQEQKASYPKEYVHIRDAYPGFGEWEKGDGIPSWYTVTGDNKDKVIQF